MKVATENRLSEIINYLAQDIAHCLYMYIDISKYGLSSNPNMTVWYDTYEDELNLVVMKYHDSIQIYTRSNVWDVDGVKDIISNEKVLMVSGRLDLIELIYTLCNDNYEITSGYVYRLENYKIFDDIGLIEVAQESDMLEIAELICSDVEIGGHYHVSDLANQLLERMRTGMGRNLIIRDNGKIIAHIATYAEYNNIAITSGLIVHPDFRKFPVRGNGAYAGGGIHA